MPRNCLIFILAILCMSTGTQCLAVVYADTDSTAPVQDGKSWATAYKTINQALNSLSGGGDVWVKTGTYREQLSLRTYTNIYGGFLGSEISLSERLPGAFPSIIDAEGKGRAVNIDAAAYATVDGFTIRRGYGDRGAGIRCNTSAQVKIRNCRIENCKATLMAGGVYYGSYAMGEMSDCVIINNTAPKGGGAVVEYHSYPTLRNNLIVRNHAAQKGGGLYCPYHSGADLENCTLAYNTAQELGGALWADYGGPVKLNYCIISNNSAPLGGGLYGAGTISSVRFTYSDFHANANGNWSGSIPDPLSYSGNYFAEPLFLMPDRNDFHLLSNSPCAGTGPYPLSSTCGVDKIGTAKLLPDGMDIALAGKIISCVNGSTVYVEELDRSAVLEVRSIPGCSVGDVFTSISGTLATDTNGHRYLVTNAVILHKRAAYKVEPVGTRISWLSELCAGMRARTWGTIGDTFPGGFVLIDGQYSIKVRYSGSAQSGKYADVTGAYTATGEFIAEDVRVLR